MPDSHISLRWSAYEHEHVERGSDWYWALGIVAVCVAITSILFHDTLFGILVLIAAGTIGLLGNVAPEMVEFEISDRGIRVGGTLHRFDEILAFWVEDEHDAPPILLVDTVKFMSPNLVIPLQDIDPRAVRTLLLEHAAEVPMKEPLAHKVLEFFGL